MAINKRTKHTEEELKLIFNQENIDDKYFIKFLDNYKRGFDELFEDYKDWKDEEFEADDSVQNSALSFAIMRIKKYAEQIAKGHGEEWAQIIVNNSEEGEREIFFAYQDLIKINSELAKKELLIYCKYLGGDKYFEKHYIYLFEIVDEIDGRIEKAKEYSKLFKEQIAKGKSEVYAHEYSNLISDGEFHKIYCEEYAYAYDKAINEDKSERYSREFAEKYGDALVDIKRRYGISEDEEQIDYAIEKVNVYMSAWEYKEENKLMDFQRFATIYENQYFNTYYTNEGNPKGEKEKIDKEILGETLKRYNKSNFI
jgi:hypothetical protein